jgi:hypothetical protein
MTPQDKKEISASLMEHMNREELHTSEAARLLNLNPCYISMAKSEKSWDSMGKAAWERLMEWFNTRCNIRDFQIPEGEEIFKRKEKEYTPGKAEVKAITEPEEHSPEAVISPAKPERNIHPKKEKHAKSVNIIINKAELADVRQRAGVLEGRLRELDTVITKMDNEFRQRFYIMEEETLSVMRLRIKDLEEGMGHLVTIPKAENKPSIVIFQRNIYQK